MATVRIPSPLRKYTGGQAKVTVPGATVGEVLQNLTQTYPGVQSRLQDDAGEIKRFINIFVNENEIRSLQGADSPVAETDEISIVPAMAGGK